MPDDWKVVGMTPINGKAPTPKNEGGWKATGMNPMADDVPGPPMPSMPTPIPAGLQGPPTIPEMEAGMPDAQRGMGVPQSLPQTTASLPQVGGAIGGSVAGIPGATLGGVIGETINQGVKATGRPLNETMAENPAWQIMKSGLEQGGFETGGKLIVGAAGKLVPNKVKQSAANVLKNQMDTAGKAIDAYLGQPTLATRTVDIATPLNRFLDNEAGQARKIGADSLANRIDELRTKWNTNYNLSNPTLVEAHKFRTDIGKYTSFAGEAHKETINHIQQITNGIVGGEITRAAPGVAALNENYANLASISTAIKGAARKSTKGYTGGLLGGSSLLFKKAGEVAPTVARGTQLLMQKNGEE